MFISQLVGQIAEIATSSIEVQNFAFITSEITIEIFA